jgi:hypothetical protein
VTDAARSGGVPERWPRHALGVSAPLDRAALVAALRTVEGVADAEVDPDEQGGLGTLRLDLVPGCDEAAVGARVSRVLREQFGLGVDADRVALVAPPAPQAPAPAAAAVEPTATVEDVSETRMVTLPQQRAGARPTIAKMHLVSSGLDVTATVTLASGERVAVGEARGLASSSGVHRAVAMATLRAVEQLVGDSARVELEHLEVTTMGAERTVVVLLTLLTAQGGESLTGAAAVRDDVRQAVIRATLDALNRRLEMLLTEV